MEAEISNDILSAFVDGALEPKEMERVARLLEERPDLDVWVRRQERVRADIHSAFADITQRPPPERLIASVYNTPVSWRWRLRLALPSLAVRTLVPSGAALAAGLALGLLLQPQGDLSLSGGKLAAHAALADALDTQLASADYSGTGPRIGISFRNRDGQDCRTFTDAGQAGLACRQGEGWAVAALVSQPAQTGGPYRMAGSEMPAALRQAVTASIVGDPFDAAAEKAARDSGWH